MLRFLSHLLLGVAIFWSVGGSLLAARQPPEQEPDEIVVTGRVVDVSGAPVEDAVVEIVPDEGSRFAASRLMYRIYGGELTPLFGTPGPTRTDEAGRFTVEIQGDTAAAFRRRACERSLKVSLDGNLPLVASLRRLTVGGTCEGRERARAPKEEARRLDLPPAVLEKGSDVEIRVLHASDDSASGDPDSRVPAADAWVRALEDESDSTWKRAERIVQADADGTARLLRPYNQPMRVSAYLPKSTPAETVVPADNPDRRQVTLRLGEAGPQELWILRESGHPLRETPVALLPGRWPVGYTDSRGQAEIYRPFHEAEIELTLGSERRSVLLPARSFRDDHRYLVDLGAPRPEFDADAGPSVYGLVRGEQGEPVADALVMMRARRGGHGDELGFALSGTDGSFQLTVPAPPDSSDPASLPREVTSPEITVSASGYLDHIEKDVAANFARGGGALGPPMEIVLRRDLRITGTVRSTTGEPLPGTLVALSNPTLPGSFAGPKSYTDVDGGFVVEGIDPEIPGLGLSVIHFDYAGREVPLSELPEPPAAAEIVLEEATNFSGRVLDPAGKPIEGVSVMVLQDEPEFSLVTMYYAGANTQSDGSFELFGLAQGSHELELNKAGYRRLVREITASDTSADQVVEFELEPLPAYVVRGRLVDESSDLEGLRVMLVAQEVGGRRYQQELSAITDGAGSFQIDGVAPGRYVVAVASADHRQRVPVEAQAVRVDGPTEIEVVLEQQTAVSGRVLGLRPEQLEHVSVVNGEVDAAAGTFRVEGLVAGLHHLRASLGSGPDWPETWTIARVEIEPGQSETVADITFEPPSRLQGVVRKADGPLAGASVALNPASHRRSQTTTDDRGSFEFDGLPPGRYEVTVWSPARTQRGQRGHRLATDVVEIDGDRELVIDVDETGGLTVSGRVVDGDGGDPLADVQLQLIQTEQPGAAGLGRPHYWPTQLTRRDGTFRFEDLSRGTWRLQLKKQGFGDTALTLELPDDEGSLPDLEMTSAEGLDLRVRSPRGDPPGSAQVTLLDDEGQAVSRATLSARSEGWMHLASAPEGRWRILVQGDGLAVLGEVEAPGPPVELTADYGTTLRVEVPELPDLTASQARLEILDARGLPMITDHSFRGYRDVLTVPPGRLGVRVTAADRVWTAQIDVLPGAYEVVRLTRGRSEDRSGGK